MIPHGHCRHAQEPERTGTGGQWLGEVVFDIAESFEFEGDVHFATIPGDCAAYEARKSSRPVGITCFATTDGERMWSNWIDDWNVSSLAIAGRTLLISRSGKLEAWELDTGISRWQFGD